MTLLVTGATGFVMSVLARRWLESDPAARLVVLDASTLDAAAERVIIASLIAHATDLGSTVVLAAHRLAALRSCDVIYELAAGRLDAVLTYWPFAAKLEAAGMRRLLSIGDALAALGIIGDLPLTGYVVSAPWAMENQAALDGFLDASHAANAILAASDAEWERIAPRTGAANTAELIRLREAYRDGIPRHWGATERDAAARLYRLLAEIGGTTNDSRIDDGSCLSRNDLVTPKLVTHLLTHMYESKERDLWISMLPVGGEDGTLSKRLCCTSDSRLIHAKTGTLARAIALSGYAENKSQGWLAFSIIVNDFAASASEIQAWIDKIALTLVE